LVVDPFDCVNGAAALYEIMFALKFPLNEPFVTCATCFAATKNCKVVAGGFALPLAAASFGDLLYAACAELAAVDADGVDAEVFDVGLVECDARMSDSVMVCSPF
jgi:hypothetical protein